MTNEGTDATASKDWVRIRIDASLKDYVTREIHDRDFKDLRDEDKSVRASVGEVAKDVGEVKTIAASKVGWAVFATIQGAIIAGLLAIAFKA